MRRFRYFRLLGLSMRGMKESVRMRNLMIEDENKAVRHCKQEMWKKYWRAWMRYLGQRELKRQEREKEMRLVDEKMLKKILRE